MRVLVIGHTYVVPENRGKLICLSEHSDVKLSLLTPDSWVDADLGHQNATPDSRLDHRIAPVRGSGNVRRYSYRFSSLLSAIRQVRPHLVQVESEADSLSAFQVGLIKEFFSFSMILFVWDNIVTTRFRHLQLARWVYRRTDHLIAGSEDALGAARTQGYRKAGSVAPQLGIDAKDFTHTQPINAWKNRKGFVVGYVGRVVRRKGLEVLFSAVGQIPEALLTIVGDGQDRALLEQKAEREGISSRVRWIGKVPHGEIPPFLASFDVLVLPSLTTPEWKEQFGHVIIEAMAARVPVIGSDSGVIPQVIGDAGLLFPEGDGSALADRIGQIMNSDPLRKNLIENGRKRVARLFSNEAIADRTYEIWKRVRAGE